MPVDRGGLDYPINVGDGFSTNLTAFTEGAKAARKEIEALATAAANLKGLAAAAREVAKASATQGRETKKAATASAEKSQQEDVALRRYRNRLREVLIERRIANIDAINASRLAGTQQTANEKRAAGERRLANVINVRAAAAANLAAVQRTGIALSTQEQARLGLLNTEQLRSLQITKKLEGVKTDTSSASIRSSQVEIAVLKRQAQAANELRVVEALRARGLNARGVAVPLPAAPGLLERIRNFSGLSSAIGKATDSANRASFTFRRLFGILAAFTAVRLALQGFRSLITELIRYNANIEQATLGITSLFVAVGDVRDATGRATTAAYGLALAQKEARRQTALLRRDSLETAATFEQLLETFQVAVAPGLQAGLDVDQIREFTVRISQAAAAAGVAQNQLAEEIRSILSGTIQVRTTRLAVALGITNQDIRDAKAAGVLVEFLNKKFEAFRAAGVLSLNTFNALFTNTQEAIQRVLESGGLNFFLSVKSTLKEIFDILINADPITGLLTPDPRAVAVVKVFGDALVSVLEAAREAARSLDTNAAVNAAKALAGGILFATKVTISFIRGFLSGLSDIGSAVEQIFKLFGGKSPLDNPGLQKSIGLLGRVLAISLAIAATASIVKLLMAPIFLGIGFLHTVMGPLVLAWRAIALLVPLIFAGVGLISVPVLVISVAVIAIVASLGVGFVLLQGWLSKLTGLDLKFSSIAKILKTGVTAALGVAALSVNSYFAKIFNELKLQVLKSSALAVDTVLGLVQEALSAIGTLSSAASAAATAVSITRAGISSDIAEQISKTALDLAQSAAAYDAARSALFGAAAGDIGKALRGNASALGFADLVKSGLTKAFAFIKSQKFGVALFESLGLKDTNKLLGEAKDLFDSMLAAPRSLVAEFDAMPGIVGLVNQRLKDNADLLNSMADSARDAADELRQGSATIGLDGDGLRARQEAFKTEAQIRRQSVDTLLQIQQLEARRITLLGQRAQNESRIASLGDKQREQVRESQQGLEKIVGLQNDLAQLQDKAVISRLRSNKLLSLGLVEQADAAKVEAAANQDGVDALEKRIQLLKDAAEIALKSAGFNAGDQGKIIDSTLARIRSAGELRLIEEQISNVESDRIAIARSLNDVLSQRLSLIASESAYTARRVASEIRIQRIQIQAEISSRDQLNNAAKRLTLAEAELTTLEAQTQISERLREREASDLDQLLAQRKEYLNSLEESQATVVSGSEDELTLLQQIATAQAAVNAIASAREAVQTRNANATALEAEQIDLLLQRARDAKKELEEPITFGLEKGLEEFVNKSLDLFSEMKNIVVSSLDGLSSLISSSIVDAFDPSNDKSFRDRFRSFLSSVAEQIIQMLVRLAIAKAVLGLGFLGGGGQAGAAVGFASGGHVKKKKPVGGMGFASGGSSSLGAGFNGRIASGLRTGGIGSVIDAIRPSGLDARDRIPAWLRKDEFVLVPEAVKAYGLGFISDLNNLLVDPFQIKTFLGLFGRSNSAKKNGRLGFASGGSVGGSSISSAISAGGGVGPTPAYIIADEAAAQALLTNGKRAFLDFLRQNKSSFMAGEKYR